MSVSNESAGANGKPSGESRRAKWARIRNRYESSNLSLRELAKLEGESVSTTMKRSMREHWQQRAQLVRSTARRLEADLDSKAIAHVQDQLAPFIEKEKARITKRGYRIGSRGLSRIEKLWKTNVPDDAKAEADGARAAETLLRMARTSLGMSDGQTPGGTLNLAILTNQAAVQVVTNPA